MQLMCPDPIAIEEILVDIVIELLVLLSRTMRK
jgi:hypothetical protein